MTEEQAREIIESLSSISDTLSDIRSQQEITEIRNEQVRESIEFISATTFANLCLNALIFGTITGILIKNIIKIFLKRR